MCSSPLITIIEKGDGFGALANQMIAYELDCEIATVYVVSAAAQSSIGLTEEVYRYLDRGLFRSRSAVPSSSYGAAAPIDGVRAALRNHRCPIIVDFASNESSKPSAHRATIIEVFFDGRVLSGIEEAVRARLGMREMTLQVKCYLKSDVGRRVVYDAKCFIDHRSLSRSVSLIIAKIPMIVQGALARFFVQDYIEDAAVESSLPRVGLTSAQQVVRLGKSIARRAIFRDQWEIMIYRDRDCGGLRRPWVRLQPGRDRFWADPFLVSDKGGLCVFFEELLFRENKGRISAVSIDDSGRSTDPIVVLEQPWHLSYPFIFEWEGEMFMIPESSGNRTVDLYRCITFPWKWEYTKTLIGGIRLADATIVEWQDRWWLFASHGGEFASMYDELFVFFAETPLGPWYHHKLNPVKIDAGSARPAGALILEDGRLIRPVQDCRGRYGDGVSFQEVLWLDEEHFAERSIHRITVGSDDGCGPIHTFNSCGRYVAIDVVGLSLRW